MFRAITETVSPNYLQVLHNAFCPVVIIIHVSNSVSSGNPPARPSSSLPRRCPHVRNCCPDAYHETPTSCVSQGARLDLPLLSWNIYNASTAIYYAGPACLGWGAEKGNLAVPASAAMSTHQRCHLALLLLLAPLHPSLSLSHSPWARFMHSSYGGPDGNFIVRRATAELRPHRVRTNCLMPLQEYVRLQSSCPCPCPSSLLPAPCCPCSCCSCCRHFLLALSGPKLLLLLFSFLLFVFSLFFAIY